jgi:DNA-binding CsgD family transcriptional regulator
MGPEEGTHLIGRAHEVARLSEAVREARHRAVLVVLHGLPGVGKSSLLAKVCREAASAGFMVRRASSSPDGSSQPFAPLLDALELGGAGAARKRAREMLASSSGGSSVAPLFVLAADSRWQAIDALCEVVSSDAHAAPLLLALDDLHWAEASAAIALRSFRQRLHDQPVLLVVTSRPSVEGELGAILQSLEDSADVVIELNRLSDAQADQLAEQCVGSALSEDMRAFFRPTRGNPLLIHQFAYDVASLGENASKALMRKSSGLAGRSAKSAKSAAFAGSAGSAGSAKTRSSDPQANDATPGLPSDGPAHMALAVDGLLARRFEHLAPKVLGLAKVASTIGNSFESELLRKAADLDKTALVVGVAALREVGLFLPDDGTKLLRFSHDLLRSGIYRTCSNEERSIMHGRVAEVLVGTGASAGAIAWHMGEQPDGVAVDRRRWLLQAADEASGTSPGLAAKLLEEALAGVELDAEEFRSDFLSLVGHLASSGRVGESERLSFSLLQQKLSPEDELTLRWWLASVLFAQSRLTEGLAVANVGWEQARDPVTGARMAALVCLIKLLLLDPTFVDTLPLAQQAAALANDPSATTIVNSLASRVAVNRLDLDEALRFATEAVRAADEDRSGLAHRYQPIYFLALVMLDFVDKPALAKYLSLGRRRAEQTGTGWSNSLFLATSSLVAQRDGRFDDALADARAAIAVSEESGIYIGVVFAHAVCAIVFVMRGDFRSAREAITDGQEVLSRDLLQFGSDILAAAEVELRVAEGHVAEGLESALETSEFYAAIGFRTAMLSAFQPILFYGHLVSREQRLAMSERVEQLFANSGESGDYLLQPARAILQAQRSGTGDAWRGAVKAVDGEGWGFHAAMVRASAAVALQAVDPEAARLFAVDANDRLSKATAFAEQARLSHLLGPKRARKGNAPTLSRTERSVAGLLAEGLSNRAIADQTGQSVRTVEAHVASILRKLNVSSRARVAAMLRN